MTTVRDIDPALARLIPVPALAACAFVAVLAMLTVPRGAHAEFAALALILSLGLWQRGRIQDAMQVDSMLVLWAATLAYLLINALWSLDLKAALLKVALLAGYAALMRLALTGIGQEEPPILDKIARAVVFASMLGAAFICFQVLTERGFTRALMAINLKFGPDLKHTQVVDGHVKYVADYLINRNCSALCVIFWPALMILSRWGNRRHAQWLGFGLIALSTIAIMKSPHETSQLALIFSATLFGLTRLMPKAGLRVVMAGWLIATLAVVPIALTAFRADLHHAKLIPASGRARIILWGYTAEQTLKKPVLGIGVGSTEMVSAQHMGSAERPDGFAYPLDTGRHSHDVYLQAWYELGAVGAVLLMLLGLGLLGAIGRLSHALQPYALAAFTSAAVTAAFSYGLWQEWFQAIFFTSVVLTRLAIAFADRTAREPAAGAA